MTPQLKEALDYVFSLESFIRNVTGGFSISEVFKALKVLEQSKVVVGDLRQIATDYLVMTDEEATEMEAYVVANYGANPDTIDKVITQALDGVIELHSLAQMFVKKP